MGESAGSHNSMPRETSITWHDPAGLLPKIRMLSGIEYVRALLEAVLPVEAFPAALGIRVADAAPGEVTLTATVADWEVNASGVAHGGFLSSLMDLASGLAVHSLLDAGTVGPHVQSSYRFLRPAARAAALTCTGHVLHRGRTLAVARTEIRDSSGRHVALGDSTHAYIQLD